MIAQNSISCNKQVKRVLFSQEGDYDADKLESSGDACDNIPEASQGCTEDFNVSNSVVLSNKVAECLGCSNENANQTQGEAEEQINFLGKVVPDWIYRKLGPSGGIMCCINEMSDLESVRSRLSSNSIKA
ncbi:CDT1-like protein b [Prosopis cineraria]|uniref:CDT1-like protein b n=1 Tax=Prosopis cineraria TaxID=364024 RepID=UPI00240EACAE|nr:CDT1-like protein b [Prosopis cineraria]